MELTPFGVYDRAVREVPELKWAMAVAGLVAMGTVVLMLTNNDVSKAVLLLAIVLVGMLLLMIVAGRFPGPRRTLVWSITLSAIAGMFMTMSAYAFGCPEKWAQLVGAQPQCSLAMTPSYPAGARTGVAARATHLLPLSSAQAQSAQVVRLSESSADCAVNSTMVREICIGGPVRSENIQLVVHSANCGSQIGKPVLVPGRTNCIAVPVMLRGCGYDEFAGLRNCRGRGWVSADVSIRP